MPKIYTKKGDNGTTRLYDGTQLSKSDIICSVIGEIDELSSRIGIVYSLIPEKINHNHTIEAITTSIQKIGCSVPDINSDSLERVSINYFNVKEIISNIQQNLQKLNSILATRSTEEQDFEESLVLKLEKYIDFMTVGLPPLTKFILPGVTHCDSQVHMCRTQTRKVERLLVQIRDDIALGNFAYKYMNRLSDFFFVLARWICHKQNFPDRF